MCVDIKGRNYNYNPLRAISHYDGTLKAAALNETLQLGPCASPEVHIRRVVGTLASVWGSRRRLRH